MKKDDKQELILDEKICVEIALRVYGIYEEEMKPPLFAFYSFPDWLMRKKEALNN